MFRQIQSWARPEEHRTRFLTLSTQTRRNHKRLLKSKNVSYTGLANQRLKEEIERMIHEDVIEEATGALWVSPVHIVYKGNGELRICVDLREANKAVIRERFLIPGSKICCVNSVEQVCFQHWT